MCEMTFYYHFPLVGNQTTYCCLNSQLNPDDQDAHPFEMSLSRLVHAYSNHTRKIICVACWQENMGSEVRAIPHFRPVVRSSSFQEMLKSMNFCV